MSLVSMDVLLREARGQGYAVGAFTVWGLASIQAVIAAAEELNQPVILQNGPLELNWAGARPLALLMRDAAQHAKIPAAVHLDHGNNLELVKRCMELGYTSVMLDASHLPFDRNVAAMREVVQAAHAGGVAVEGELGRIGGEEAGMNVNEGDAHLTDPEEAAEYVKQTGVDALAVGIGTVHGFYKSRPNIRLDLLKRIAEKVSIPLVLHGGSGTPDEIVREAISLGIAKINICTELVAAYNDTMVRQQTDEDFRYHVPGIFTKPRTAAAELVKKKIRLFAGL
ncbi:MAG: D-tagatose-1,6-bisphosphate aldolase subunit GatY [Planctomycetes bacterium ADurb.Bin412]|nr:MAG: D-tagatose-1,6-bisphosphate aldolase subunit GatY [Planctomycetes bacterium ADurb.Bin412]